MEAKNNLPRATPQGLSKIRKLADLGGSTDAGKTKISIKLF